VLGWAESSAIVFLQVSIEKRVGLLRQRAL
jgi:hypothetical protein